MELEQLPQARSAGLKRLVSYRGIHLERLFSRHAATPFTPWVVEKQFEDIIEAACPGLTILLKEKDESEVRDWALHVLLGCEDIEFEAYDLNRLWPEQPIQRLLAHRSLWKESEGIINWTDASALTGDSQIVQELKARAALYEPPPQRENTPSAIEAVDELTAVRERLKEPELDPETRRGLMKHQCELTDDPQEFIDGCRFELTQSQPDCETALWRLSEDPPPFSETVLIECLTLLLPKMKLKDALYSFERILDRLHTSGQINQRTIPALQEAILAHPWFPSLLTRAATNYALRDWVTEQARKHYHEHPELLSALRAVRTPEHLKIVEAAAASPSPNLKAAAEKALYKWPESDVLKRICLSRDCSQFRPWGEVLAHHHEDPALFKHCEGSLRTFTGKYLEAFLPYAWAADFDPDLLWDCMMRADAGRPMLAVRAVRERLWDERDWTDWKFEDLFAWFDTEPLLDKMIQHVRDAAGWGWDHVIPLALQLPDHPDLMNALRSASEAGHHKALSLLTLLHGDRADVQELAWQLAATNTEALTLCLQLAPVSADVLGRGLDAVEQGNKHGIRILLNRFGENATHRKRIEARVCEWMWQNENHSLSVQTQYAVGEILPNLIPVDVKERFDLAGPKLPRELRRLSDMREEADLPLLMHIAERHLDERESFGAALGAATEILKKNAHLSREAIQCLATSSLANKKTWWYAANCLATLFPDDEDTVRRVIESAPPVCVAMKQEATKVAATWDLREISLTPAPEFVASTSFAFTQTGRTTLVEFMTTAIDRYDPSLPGWEEVDGSSDQSNKQWLGAVQAISIRLCARDFNEDPAIQAVLDRLLDVPWWSTKTEQRLRHSEWRRLANALIERRIPLSERIAEAQSIARQSTVPALANHAAYYWLNLLTHRDPFRKKHPDGTPKNVQNILTAAQSVEEEGGPLWHAALGWLRFVRSHNPKLATENLDQLLRSNPDA